MIVKGDESNPFLFFENLAQRFNGSWNGEEYASDNDFGKIQSVTFGYMNSLYVGITELELSEEMIFENDPITDRQFVSIRIGKIGDFNKKHSQAQQKDSIYIYNNLQKFKIVYPAKTKMSWFFIRFPKDIYDLLGTDKSSDFYQLISNPKPWFYYSPMLLNIEVLINEMYNVLHDKVVRRGLFLSKAIEIITRLREHGTANKLSNIAYDIHPDDLDVMLQLKDEIIADFTKIPNVSQLSAEKGMSKSKLQRGFKSVFKMPILHFFNHQRVLEGQRRIRTTHHDFTQIAIELGYTDLSHFSRVYKQFLGKRPSEEIRNVE
ncbi:AraC family transcriptional regulator [Flammeovirga sp. EKP202]|uniref:helix-turn-helix domain-containing protein n=1 Tax=Flammeovirga sp. EKP202 TaxID=2770592 RepID=UPI00165F63D3|nr:AraC family transcriptional regulator [Flammeovirga sp. EKP202]MBD0400855.1 helix-turn-helix transcriptional regulator [Flammeovirga sp. EKP202]